MLTRLLVENLALAERTEVEPGRGLTVLTGETGAGKSLIVDALSLLAGARGAPDFIRTGEKTAVVEAAFHTSDRELVQSLHERGIELDGGELIFRRVLNRDGRHRSYLNGAQVAAGFALEVAGCLLDIHGQHEQQSLLSPAAHLDILDDASGHASLVSEYRLFYERWRALQEEEEELRAMARDRAQRLDFLRFQIDELEQVAPRGGEWDELENERRRLEHAEKLGAVSYEGEALLYAGDDAVAPRLTALAKRLDEAARYDDAFRRFGAEAREIAVRAEELARDLGSYAGGIEAEPERLNELNERLDVLSRLRRKYGDLETVASRLEDMRAEAGKLADSDNRLAELAKEREQVEKRMSDAGQRLRKARREAAAPLGERLEAALRPLGMNGASVEWSFSEEEPGPRGLDRVELLFSANRGEPPRPLQKVASGGELSRVMLALHTVSLQSGGPDCVIFDEIDAGIGGEVGDAIGRALRQVAENRQVLCVTHLPQIAVYAGSHWQVRKRIAGERTVSEVFPIEGDERLSEIGRMLSGRVDEASLEHARSLLERAAG